MLHSNLLNANVLLDQFLAALKIAILFSALPLLPSLLSGLFISIFQAATQIQDQTLTFIPKLLSVSLALYFASGFITSTWHDYFSTPFEAIIAQSELVEHR